MVEKTITLTGVSANSIEDAVQLASDIGLTVPLCSLYADYPQSTKQENAFVSAVNARTCAGW